MASWQCTHLRNLSVLLCSKGNIIFSSCQSRSCSSQLLADLAEVPAPCQQNLPYFCCVRSTNTLAIYCGKAYSLHDNLKMMAGGHAVHEQQTISSTTVLITHTFCMENEKHLTPRGLGACQRDPIMQVSHGEANFIFTLRNYITFTPGSFGVQPCTAPCSSSSSISAAPFGAGERNHTYSFVGQPTDKNKLRRRLLRCIHDRLAFDVAARQSCGSHWRQLSASLQAAVASACCQICACALP